jgi:hypothetical protein
MRGRRLTTWAMARPCLLYSYGSEQTIIYFSRALQIVCWRSDLKWDCVVARLSFVRPGISRMSLQNTCFFPLHLVLCKTAWIVQYYVDLLSAFKREKSIPMESPCCTVSVWTPVQLFSQSINVPCNSYLEHRASTTHTPPPNFVLRWTFTPLPAVCVSALHTWPAKQPS